MHPGPPTYKNMHDIYIIIEWLKEYQIITSADKEVGQLEPWYITVENNKHSPDGPAIPL